MSFFEHLMSSVTGQPAKPFTPAPNRAALLAKKATNNVATTTSNGVGLSNAASSGLKRKADDISTTGHTKIAKLDGTAASNSDNKAPSSKMHGTEAQAGKAPISKPNTTSNTKAPLAPNPTPQVKARAAAIPNPNSYAAMMARAAEAHANRKTDVWEIKHMPTDKRPRQHKRRAEALERAKALEARNKRGSPESRDSSARSTPAPGGAAGSRKVVHPKYGDYKKGNKHGLKESSKVDPGRVKKKREPLEYKGTMALRPGDLGKLSAAERQRMAAQKARRLDSTSGRAKDGHRGGTDVDMESQEEISEGSDGQGMESDPTSEDSSQMGGGGFDELEAEEQASLRIAREEDAAALAEEDRLKKQKEERRRKLQALAARSKPQRY